MSGNQVGNGKAFEYCCLIAVKNAAIKRGIKTSISPDDKNYSYAESLFVRFSAGEQKALMLGAEAAVRFIFSCEPYMKDNVLATELCLSMQSDAAGQKGDVRDIIFLRWSSFGSGKKEWKCGISCKHNHEAIKHPRVGLTRKSDFLSNWTKNKFSCSDKFRESIGVIEDVLAACPEHETWKNRFNKNISGQIYAPVVKAIYDELDRLKDDPDFVASFFDFLLGTEDFYKVMSFDNERYTQVSVFNFNGSLNKRSPHLSPDRTIRVTPKPGKILSLWHDESYIRIYFDDGWTIKMRIHSASSRIERSLKFDAQLEGVPASMMNLCFSWDLDRN